MSGSTSGTKRGPPLLGLPEPEDGGTRTGRTRTPSPLAALKSVEPHSPGDNEPPESSLRPGAGRTAAGLRVQQSAIDIFQELVMRDRRIASSRQRTSATAASVGAGPAPIDPASTKARQEELRQRLAEYTRPEEEEHMVFVQTLGAVQMEFDSTISSLGETDVGEGAVQAKVVEFYKKMHRSILRSAHKAEGLYGKHLQLQRQWVDNLALQDILFEKDLDDDSTIARLQGMIRNLHQEQRRISERTRKLMGSLHTLQMDIKHLQDMVKDGISLTFDQEESLYQLRKAREQATNDLAHEVKNISTIRQKMISMSEQIRSTMTSISQTEQRISDMKNKITGLKMQEEANVYRREQLEVHAKELRAVISAKMHGTRQKQEQVNQQRRTIENIEAYCRAQQLNLAKTAKENERLKGEMEQLMEDADVHKSMARAMCKENANLKDEHRRYERDLAKMRREAKRTTAIKNEFAARARAAERTGEELELERRNIRERINEYEAEIASVRAASRIIQSEIEEEKARQNVLTRDTAVRIKSAQGLTEVMVLAEVTGIGLKADVDREITRQQKLEKLRATLSVEAAALLAKSVQVQRKAVGLLGIERTREERIVELKRNLINLEVKLRKAQNLLEGMRQDRNVYFKNLQEAQWGMAELKRTMRMSNFEVGGLKNDLESKAAALAAEAAEAEKSAQEREALEDEIAGLTYQCKLGNGYVARQLEEQERLEAIVREATQERDEERKHLEAVVQDRDKLAARFAEQEQELEAIHMKRLDKHSTLNTGFALYVSKRKERNRLLCKARELRRETAQLDALRTASESRRLRAIRLTSMLLKAKTRLSALEKELSRPVRVHRWRGLQAHDPTRMELLRMIAKAQRSLHDTVERERAAEDSIREHEELYVRLRRVEGQMGSPAEAAEVAASCREALKEKCRTYRHIGREIAVYVARCRETRHAVDVLNRRAAETNEKYLAGRLRQQDGGDVDNTSRLPAVAPDLADFLPAGTRHRAMSPLLVQASS